MTRIVVDKSTDHTKPQSICFLPQYQRNLPRFVDNWKQVENKDSDLKVHVLYYAKWATCTRHFSFQKFCNELAQHAEKIRKNYLGKNDDAYSFSIRVQTTMKHISICFLPQYQRQRKWFFRARAEKSHCATHWREQRGMESYRQRQIILKIANQIARLAAIVVKKIIFWNGAANHVIIIILVTPQRAVSGRG